MVYRANGPVDALLQNCEGLYNAKLVNTTTLILSAFIIQYDTVVIQTNEK